MDEEKEGEEENNKPAEEPIEEDKKLVEDNYKIPEEPPKELSKPAEESSKNNQSLTDKLRKNPFILSTIVCGVLAVLLLIAITSGGITGKVVSEKEAGENVLDFVSSQVEGAELVEVNQKSGLYEVILSMEGREVPVYITMDGTLAGSLIPISGSKNTNTKETTETLVEGSTFKDNGDEICTDEQGRPYVLLFSTTWCSHCKWISNTFDSLVNEYSSEEINLQHWEIDIGDNTLTTAVEEEVPKDMDALYKMYNPRGSIPTFVFGCKYSRTGNGYESQDDLNAELEDFKLIIDKLI